MEIELYLSTGQFHKGVIEIKGLIENFNKQRKNINFTPQEKPAENIMTRWFAK